MNVVEQLFLMQLFQSKHLQAAVNASIRKNNILANSSFQKVETKKQKQAVEPCC